MSGKGNFEDHMTIREIARYLNVNERTVERWRDSGKIPPPAQITEAGWKLWSPEQVAGMLQFRLTQKRKIRARG